MKKWQKIFLISVAGVMILDQGSKYLVTLRTTTLLINQGISFGWLRSGEDLPFVLAVVVGLIIGLTFHFWPRYPLAFGLFFGGVLANLFDRMRYGGVHDWLPIPGMGLYNNLADWAIAIAVIILLQQTISEWYARKNTVLDDKKQTDSTHRT